MHSQRTRIDEGGRRITGNRCCYAGARVHGGEHESGPQRKANDAVHDKRHEDEEVSEGGCGHSVLRHAAEDRIESVSEALKAVAAKLNDQSQQANRNGGSVQEVAKHSGLRFLALGSLDQFRPYALPVIGAQVLTRYRAFGGLLDAHTVFRIGAPTLVAVTPVTQLVWIDVDGARQLRGGWRAWLRKKGV